MKKTLLAIAMMGFLFPMQAQKTLKDVGGVRTKKHVADFLKKKAHFNALLSKPAVYGFNPSYKNPYTVGGIQNRNVGPTPSSSIEAGTWTQLTNIDNHTKQLIAVNYTFGAGANVFLRLLNPDTSVAKTLTIEIPETANAYSIYPEMSSADFNGNTKPKFMMYLHYFEGGMGPEFQKNAVWIIDEDGTILSKLEDADSAKFIKNTDGTAGIITSIETEDQVILNTFNNHFEKGATKEYPSELFTFFMGAPISFINVAGEPKLVVAHYEKLFMDNATLEVFPNNHVIIDILDLDLNANRSLSLPLPAYEEDSYIFGFGEFGIFYGNNKYDITQHVYNNDDQLEVVYSINFQDLMNDSGWRNYFVVNEEGTILKAYEQNIIDMYQMKEIAGQNDQMGFVLADEEGNQSIEMFDVKQFSDVINFPAVYNGEQLSGYFNRIPKENSYQYLIGLGEPLKVGNDYFGVLNTYTTTGEKAGSINLNIGPAPLNFTPLLYDDDLDPKVFNTDDELEYSYVYMFKNEGDNAVYNSFNVAKANAAPFFTVNGGGAHGNLSASGFLLDNANAPYKLAMVYGESYEDLKYTEFYDLPFNLLGTSEVGKNQVSIYTDKTRSIVGFTQKIKSYKVYGLSGQLVTQGLNAKEISTQGWIKGVYIIQYQTENGAVGAKKVLIP